MSRVISSTESTRTVATTTLLRDAGIVLAGTLLLAICAHVSVPLVFTPVPLTLAPLPVLLLALMLSPRLAVSTLAAYLLEGAAGLPVFSPQGLGGVAQLLGPTGGYLLCYPLAAGVIAMMWKRSEKKFHNALLSASVGSGMILAAGALWMIAVYHATPANALIGAVLPFIPGDVLKVAVVAGVIKGFTRLRQSHA